MPLKRDFSTTYYNVNSIQEDQNWSRTWKLLQNRSYYHDITNFFVRNSFKGYKPVMGNKTSKETYIFHSFE
ncbi:hypothetical protein LEP1GSC163_2566 [Leptospira santarosai str. CBC379]|nr:hypothetical protein LEP1GSC163_2566 [Leptospira santarosai str. CBC379]